MNIRAEFQLLFPLSLAKGLLSLRLDELLSLLNLKNVSPDTLLAEQEDLQQEPSLSKGHQEILHEDTDIACLYECELCKALKLTSKELSSNELSHKCKLSRIKDERKLALLLESLDLGLELEGEFQLLETGQADNLLKWAHTLSLNLHDPLKPGI